MSICPLCKKDTINPIQLWDDNEYCSVCIETISPELLEYAGNHKTLESNINFIEFAPKGKRCESLAVRVRNIFISSVVAGWFFWSVISENNSLPYNTSFLCFLISLLIFYFSYSYLTLNSRYGSQYNLCEGGGISPYDLMKNGIFPFISSNISPYIYTQRKSYFPHPKIVISSGVVNVHFYEEEYRTSFAVSPTPFVLRFDLTDVSLIEDSTKLDPFFSIIPDIHQPISLLLDFSKVIHTCSKKTFLFTYNQWLLHPYIVCCSIEYDGVIWKDFFRLLSLSKSFETSRR